jgi:uncharacterized membrane protein
VGGSHHLPAAQLQAGLHGGTQVMLPLHVVCAISALLLGVVVFRRRKGTVLHTRLGWAFVACMLGTDVTALFIAHYDSPVSAAFVLLGLWNLAWVSLGVGFAWRRPSDRWLTNHYYFMAYAYLGLLAALVARLPLMFSPDLQIAIWFGVGVTFTFGSLFVEIQGRKMLSLYRR